MSLKSIKKHPRVSVLCGAPKRQKFLISSYCLPEAYLQQQESVLSLLSCSKLQDFQCLMPLISDQPGLGLPGDKSIYSQVSSA